MFDKTKFLELGSVEEFNFTTKSERLYKLKIRKRFPKVITKKIVISVKIVIDELYLNISRSIISFKEFKFLLKGFYVSKTECTFIIYATSND